MRKSNKELIELVKQLKYELETYAEGVSRMEILLRTGMTLHPPTWALETLSKIEKLLDICQKCDGSGWIYYSYDPSPAGVALSPGTMTDVDPCPECNPDGDKEDEL